MCKSATELCRWDRGDTWHSDAIHRQFILCRLFNLFITPVVEPSAVIRPLSNCSCSSLICALRLPLFRNGHSKKILRRNKAPCCDHRKFPPDPGEPRQSPTKSSFRQPNKHFKVVLMMRRENHSNKSGTMPKANISMLRANELQKYTSALWRRYSWFESMRGSHSTRCRLLMAGHPTRFMAWPT